MVENLNRWLAVRSLDRVLIADPGQRSHRRERNQPSLLFINVLRGGYPDTPMSGAPDTPMSGRSIKIWT
jgi:hypothetical protein